MAHASRTCSNHKTLLPKCYFFDFIFDFSFCFEADGDGKAKLFVTLVVKTDELTLSSLQTDVFGLEVTKN